MTREQLEAKVAAKEFLEWHRDASSEDGWHEDVSESL